MAADFTYSTVAFPYAIVGVPYEAGIAIKSNATGISALAVVAVTANGETASTLPPGITVSSTTDPRLIGTPTATLNPAWTQAATVPPNNFYFQLTCTDTAGTLVSATYVITVYGSFDDVLDTGTFETPGAMALQRKLN